jgi:hypothetical protein
VAVVLKQPEEGPYQVTSDGLTAPGTECQGSLSSACAVPLTIIGHLIISVSGQGTRLCYACALLRLLLVRLLE